MTCFIPITTFSYNTVPPLICGYKTKKSFQSGEQTEQQEPNPSVITGGWRWGFQTTSHVSALCKLRAGPFRKWQCLLRKWLQLTALFPFASHKVVYWYISDRTECRSLLLCSQCECECVKMGPSVSSVCCEGNFGLSVCPRVFAVFWSVSWPMCLWVCVCVDHRAESGLSGFMGGSCRSSSPCAWCGTVCISACGSPSS